MVLFKKSKKTEDDSIQSISRSKTPVTPDELDDLRAEVNSVEQGRNEKKKGLVARISAARAASAHQGMERFGRTSMLFAATGALIAVPAIYSSATVHADAIRDTALYGSSFTTSKSQNTGEVQGVFVSPDRTRAMILMDFKDATKMPTRAEDYRAFVTGSDANFTADNKRLKTKIDGKTVVFGNTGTVGVLLESDQPFEPQVLRITLRSSSELTTGNSTSAEVPKDIANDTSFTQYDQWRIFANPGANGVTETAALEGDIDPGSLYDAVAINPVEEEQRELLASSLATMRSQLASIEDYSVRVSTSVVDGSAVELVPTPAPIAGDQMSCRDTKVTDLAACIPEDLIFSPASSSPQGYNFDWASGSVREGYLDEVIPDGQTAAAYMSEKAKAKSEGPSADSQLSVDADAWKLANGKSLLDYSQNIASVQNANANITLLTNAWRSYYQTKSKYQNEDLSKLLNLEMELKDAVAGYSENNNDNAVLAY